MLTSEKQSAESARLKRTRLLISSPKNDIQHRKKKKRSLCADDTGSPAEAEGSGDETLELKGHHMNSSPSHIDHEYTGEDRVSHDCVTWLGIT